MQAGFTGILNLDFAMPYAKATPPGVQTATVAIREEEAVQVSALHEAAETVRRWRTEGRNVFVHCDDGKSRSPLAIAVYLMRDRGWDFPSAMWYIRQRRSAWPRPQLRADEAISQMGR